MTESPGTQSTMRTGSVTRGWTTKTWLFADLVDDEDGIGDNIQAKYNDWAGNDWVGDKSLVNNYEQVEDRNRGGCC